MLYLYLPYSPGKHNFFFVSINIEVFFFLFYFFFFLISRMIVKLQFIQKMETEVLSRLHKGGQTF